MNNNEELKKAIITICNAKEDINKAIDIIIEQGNPQSNKEMWKIGKEINNSIDTLMAKSNVVYNKYVYYIIAARNKK